MHSFNKKNAILFTKDERFFINYTNVITKNIKKMIILHIFFLFHCTCIIMLNNVIYFVRKNVKILMLY